MRKLFILLMFVSLTVIAADVKIIPVAKWPKVIYTAVGQACNPSVEMCVKAGYRLLTPRPPTPAGKRIKSEKIIQDPLDATKCKYDIVYKDIPEPPPPPPPEVLTNVLADKVTFRFTTNGVYRGVIWNDAPVTNAVK